MSSSFNMEFGYPLEAERAKKERWPILIPVGTMEYHADHCPYGCDALVSQGIAQRIAEKIDAIVFPTIWYGVASWAVGGPEKNTINVDCDTFESYIYCILKSLFQAGFNRRIYLIISHQTEDHLPMELACMKAAKKLTFEYLDQEMGYGWWGDNKNKEFYSQLKGDDNPWNWVRIITGSARKPHSIRAEFGADHAGKWECSVLEHLYPGSIKMDRLADCDAWFAQSAWEMSEELGATMVRRSIEEHIKYITGEEE